MPYAECRVVQRTPTSAILPPCVEKQRLRMVYSGAAARHTRAVDEVLRVRGGTASAQELEHAKAVADKTRKARSLARTALEHHKQEHGC